jgi:hypothetical protein
MNLAEFQRTFFDLMRQPLTTGGGQRTRTADGQSVTAIAVELVTPGPRLSPFERLELYSQGYWARLLDTLRGEFPGLRALLGRMPFERLASGYLADCPPDSFDLRRLGARLPTWLADHPDHARRQERCALDMARLEWAEIEARDGAEWLTLSLGEIGGLGNDPRLPLQPHLTLLELAYPVDAVLTGMRRSKERDDSGAAPAKHKRASVRRVALPPPESVHLAVHRHQGVVYFKRLEAEAFGLLKALQQGRTLSEAIQESLAASVDGVSRLQQWFAEWATVGWFCHPPADSAEA